VWTYILRRILLMIPTLFGVTVISFCIMQLAPGDPLMTQLGAGGAAGQSSQTREAFLIQKRDLKLDKPLVLNFNYFRDYSSPVQIAAHYLSLSLDEIKRELPELAKSPTDPQAQARLKFLRSLKVPDLEANLRNPEQFSSLARKIQAWVQVYCEDTGRHGVPDAIRVLESSDSDTRLKIGAIRCLNRMVIDPFVFTYSSHPSESETANVVAAWTEWWRKNEKKFPPLDPDRKEVLEEQFTALVAETDRSVLFEKLQDSSFDRDDLPFFADKLLDKSSSLPKRFVTSIVLKLYISEPLKLDVPLDAAADDVADVVENWKVHFATHRAEYEYSTPARCLRLFTDTQYAHMVWRLATFNFGRSALATREPVSEKIWVAVKVSAPLMLMAQILIYLAAVPLGVICSVRRGRLADRSISLGLFLLYSIPPFVAGMLFLMWLCYGKPFKWFPTLALHSDGAASMAWWPWLTDYFWHATLPVICLSLFSLAGLAMYARSSMLDVLGQDFVRTARAKGVSEPRVILKHALRNGLIPIITLFSSFLPAMLGGSVLVEFLFGIPGMGRLSWASIEQKDFPTLMGLVYIDAIVVMFSILLSDLLYIVVDPRISFSGKGNA
jgi:ABC-type dipeptide/oligopeptide/nickel transport system permease component